MFKIYTKDRKLFNKKKRMIVNNCKIFNLNKYVDKFKKCLMRKIKKRSENVEYEIHRWACINYSLLVLI